MNKKAREVLTTENTLLGLRPADLLGIIIMIIPFFISYAWHKEIPIKFLGLFPTGNTNDLNIWPNVITATIAVLFYFALILRYDFFKANNLGQAIISAIRAFLDCWVLASLLSIIIPTVVVKGENFTSLFENKQFLLLLFAVLLTWLGMKTVAGYSWIIFIFTASGHMFEINNAMGRTGAVFIILTAISLFLQVKDVSDIRDFLSEFKGYAGNYANTIKGNMTEATYDAARKAYVVKNLVQQKVGLTPDAPPARTVQNNNETPDAPSGKTVHKNNPQIDFSALDVNNDGVVDEKDFALMQQMSQSKGKHQA